jgi:hypothetical protein
MPSRSEWETKLTSWVKPASQSEQEKRDRTERAIADALQAARGMVVLVALRSGPARVKSWVRHGVCRL